MFRLKQSRLINIELGCCRVRRPQHLPSRSLQWCPGLRGDSAEDCHFLIDDIEPGAGFIARESSAITDQMPVQLRADRARCTCTENKSQPHGSHHNLCVTSPRQDDMDPGLRWTAQFWVLPVQGGGRSILIVSDASIHG